MNITPLSGGAITFGIILYYFWSMGIVPAVSISLAFASIIATIIWAVEKYRKKN
jgi:hypothetical protein